MVCDSIFWPSLNFVSYNRGRDSWIKFCNLEKNSAQFLNALIQKEIEDSAPALIPVDDYLEANCHAEIEYSHDRSRTISCRSTVMGSTTPVQVDSSSNPGLLRLGVWIPGSVESTPPPPYNQVVFPPYLPPCQQCFPPIAFQQICFYSHPPYGQVKNLKRNA